MKSDKNSVKRISVDHSSDADDFDSFLSLDLYDGGLDFRIFQYYFERRMLYALVRYNAGE